MKIVTGVPLWLWPITSNGKRAITWNQTIYLPSSFKPGTSDYGAAVAHESVHVQQQAGHWWPGWAFKYATNAGFRKSVELPAYAAQIVWLIKQNATIDTKLIAEEMATGYHGMMTFPDALAWVQKTVADNGGRPI